MGFVCTVSSTHEPHSRAGTNPGVLSVPPMNSLERSLWCGLAIVERVRPSVDNMLVGSLLDVVENDVGVLPVNGRCEGLASASGGWLRTATMRASAESRWQPACAGPLSPLASWRTSLRSAKAEYPCALYRVNRRVAVQRGGQLPRIRV